MDMGFNEFLDKLRTCTKLEMTTNEIYNKPPEHYFIGSNQHGVVMSESISGDNIKFILKLLIKSNIVAFCNSTIVSSNTLCYNETTVYQVKAGAWHLLLQ